MTTRRNGLLFLFMFKKKKLHLLVHCLLAKVVFMTNLNIFNINTITKLDFTKKSKLQPQD